MKSRQPSDEGEDPPVDGDMHDGSGELEGQRMTSKYSSAPGRLSSGGSGGLFSSKNPYRHKGFLVMLAHAWEFEFTCSLLILLNCFTMGLQAHAQVQHDALAPGVVEGLDMADHIFTAFFLLEFLLKFRVFGPNAFRPVNTDG